MSAGVGSNEWLSMPAGTTIALLAAQYHRDAELGSKVVVLTTLLSLFTITGWSLVLN